MKYVTLSLCLFLCSCGNLAVRLTPVEIKEAVAKATAVAHKSIVDQPKDKDLEAFLQANYEVWASLDKYYNER